MDKLVQHIPTINGHKSINFKCFPKLKINEVEYDYTKNDTGIIINNISLFEKEFVEQPNGQIAIAKNWIKNNVSFEVPIASNLITLDYVKYCLDYDFIFSLKLEDDISGILIKCEQAWFEGNPSIGLSANRVSRVKICSNMATFL